MHILVTGANGFVGRALVQRLLAQSPAPTRLTLMDLSLDGAPSGPAVHALPGSIADAALVAQAHATPVDCVFHLASVPGGAAERDPLLGREVNVRATEHLLDAARAQQQAGGPAPVFVFASSIAALGSPLPAAGVDDDTRGVPSLSYGAHKLIGEILVADATRRGWVDGRSLRLPGIVARPPGPSGLLSAFMSDLIRELAAGRPFTCPIPAESTTWLLSVPAVVEALLHGARIDGAALGAARACTLPALCLTLGELAQATGQAFGVDVDGQVSWQQHPQLQANFGAYPPLHTPLADAAGFRHDGDARTLARRALELD